MRVVLWTFVMLIVLGVQSAYAQTASAVPRGESTEEIVVRGRRLTDLRLEVERLRVRAYDVFNEINSTDDFDIQCDSETRTGTRVGRQVCVAQFEGRVSSRASKDYIAAIKDQCGGQLMQDCMFDPNKAGYGLAAAKAIEGEAPRQRALLSQEIHRLARTDLRFGQAILDFYDASLRYEEERNRTRGRSREPRE